MLRIYDLVIELVTQLKPYADAIGRHDPNLARQMRDAMTSVPLNVAEGSHSRGGNRAARYHTARGSMSETLSCATVGHALGYCPQVRDDLHEAISRVIGTLVKVSR